MAEVFRVVFRGREVATKMTTTVSVNPWLTCYFDASKIHRRWVFNIGGGKIVPGQQRWPEVGGMGGGEKKKRAGGGWRESFFRFFSSFMDDVTWLVSGASQVGGGVKPQNRFTQEWGRNVITIPVTSCKTLCCNLVFTSSSVLLTWSKPNIYWSMRSIYKGRSGSVFSHGLWYDLSMCRMENSPHKLWAHFVSYNSHHE